MPINDVLSICIPTYNRAQLLRGCLENIIPQAREHEIPIYISDNASEDDTAGIVSAARRKYRHVYYSKNPSNLGADHNIAIVLKRSRSKYAWLFGDKYRLFPGAVDAVLGQVPATECDLIVVNNSNTCYPDRRRDLRVKDIPGPSLYSDANKLLGDLGWHMTMMSSLIFGSKIIEKGNYEKYRGTQFSHMGVIFDYLSDQISSVLYISRPLFYNIRVPSGWIPRTFEIFAKKWFDLVNSLPASYFDETKKKCIKDHGVKSGLFSFQNLLVLRGRGYFNYDIYKRYKFYFPYITNVPQFILFLLSFMPVPAGFTGFLKKIRDFCNPRLK